MIMYGLASRLWREGVNGSSRDLMSISELSVAVDTVYLRIEEELLFAAVDFGCQLAASINSASQPLTPGASSSPAATGAGMVVPRICVYATESSVVDTDIGLLWKTATMILFWL